jgi:hypothetical protein
LQAFAATKAPKKKAGPKAKPESKSEPRTNVDMEIKLLVEGLPLYSTREVGSTGSHRVNLCWTETR